MYKLNKKLKHIVNTSTHRNSIYKIVNKKNCTYIDLRREKKKCRPHDCVM